ncbi:hypothetical protein [Micromonospora yangpuensis]|uniref:Uncharacterized protein n=1 Tax=Micromonospora yangpuensis TaxID=683228 RepID=A0A1C6VDQ5_9ACTN|nr:hypothetical protein [Micromonospora yangpuensis]GGM14135.1 hypothetical protein GCM10012279_35340 [Micromonospora yangpuensis]SCL64501.1 hypothetical protein GA0070617_5489 [Micromonospora yangpuensis]
MTDTVVPHELDARLRAADKRITALHLAVTRADSEAARAKNAADAANLARQAAMEELSAAQLASLQLDSRLRRAIADDLRRDEVVGLVVLHLTRSGGAPTDVVAKALLADLAELIDGVPQVLGRGIADLPAGRHRDPRWLARLWRRWTGR